MIYRSLFPRDFLSELERLQNEVRQGFDISPSIRGFTRGGFPALNIGSTVKSVEIYAFAPGVDPASIDVQLEKGVLTVAGERKSALPPAEAKATTNAHFAPVMASAMQRRASAKPRQRPRRRPISMNALPGVSVASLPFRTISTPAPSPPGIAMASCTSAFSAARLPSRAASTFNKEVTT